MKLSAVLLIGLLLATNQCWSWNNSGHRTIALIAYELVDAATREKIIAIIAEHPRLQQDFVAQRPRNFENLSQEDQQRWMFSQIAVWSDLVRNISNPLEQERYHRSRWHYINLPIFVDNAENQRGANDNVAFSTDVLGDHSNIMQVLNYIRVHFNQPDTSIPKSIQLCWLFHLAGDIHQPLHSSALYSSGLLENGDRGGGLILVEDNNLHGVWDAAGGNTNNLQQLNSEIKILLDNNELTAEGKLAAKDLDFEMWLMESHRLAESAVYGSRISQAATLIQEIEHLENSGAKEIRATLNEAYRRDMKKIAQIRIVEAGFRLAALLQSDEFFPLAESP